ncbi:MAG: hypothetical protein NVSMB9_02200 [Isosphaeraceae bacterium]
MNCPGVFGLLPSFVSTQIMRGRLALKVGLVNGETVPMRHVVLCLCLSFAPFGLAATLNAAAPPELVASTPPRTPEEERKGFHLPPGFVAELVAAEPEIHKPMNLAFDDRGRLWVTHTLEYPYPAPEGKTPRDGVKILSDFGPDGRARNIHSFVDGLNIPIGLLPLPNAREGIVHSIPKVYKFSDTDGDNTSDKREPLYQSYGFKDTHGMTNAFTWGFDGWVYACHGFTNESTVQGADKKPITMQSGNTYRMRPDGSHAEYYTHGQVNPFGLAFDPLGNLYSCDCHSRPIYQLLRGAWYPSFGKPHDGLGFGPEMITHDHGSTGIAGIVYYAADHFPKPFHDTILIGNVVTSRINLDRIEWHGSTPRAIEQPDFLVSDDPWFRPVDLELGPDGALYVADFYNKIIGHYEVPLTHPGRDRERGRIWRIVYRGEDGKNHAASPREDWTSASTDALIEDLGHTNLSVRIKAANQLSERSKKERPIEALATAAASDPNTDRRVHALWVLQRWGELTDERVLHACNDKDRTVRVHALRALAERESLDGELAEIARKGLRDEDAFVRRASAETLGRHPDVANIPPLLAVLETTQSEDTHLVHVIRMALRDQFVDSRSWSKIEPATLSDRAQADIADITPGLHSPESAHFLSDYISRSKVKPEVLGRYVHHIARYGASAEIERLVPFLQDRAGDTGLSAQVDLIRSYQQGLQEGGKSLPGEARNIARRLTGALLDSSRPDEVLQGIELAGIFRFKDVHKRLVDLALSNPAHGAPNAEALSALATIDATEAFPILGRVLADSARAPLLRERAATLLGSTNRAEARAALLSALPTAPEATQTAIATVLVRSHAGAEALLEAVSAGKASARLLQENRVAGPLANAGIPNLGERLQTLLKGLPPADEKLNALITSLREDFVRSREDAVAGAKVFETNCAVCHQIGGKGSKVGPQLDGIGVRGLDRVLEDVVNPSRNVDQAFRATSLGLKDGRVVSGLFLREEGEILIVADAQGKEVCVPRDSVEERSISPLSPMPPNFADQIPRKDFLRLIAYLLSQRPPE